MPYNNRINLTALRAARYPARYTEAVHDTRVVGCWQSLHVIGAEPRNFSEWPFVTKERRMRVQPVWKIVLTWLVGVMVLTGCAEMQPRAERDPAGGRAARFEFGVIGDAPYILEEEVKVAAAIAEMNRSELAFVVHVGDIQADPRVPYRGGVATCTDASLERRKELFAASRHPFILTPGDNDWTDCHLVKDRLVDPLERLARLRVLFFPDTNSLGQRKMALTVQAADPRYGKYVENRQWTHGGVLFVTLHIVGSNNNRSRTPEMDAEYVERNAANLAWLTQGFERARQERARGVVILTQANPLFETTWSATQVRRYLPGLPVNIPEPRRPTGYDDFLAVLEREVLAFPRPVLLIHGDTHVFRVDKPLVRSADKRLIEHFTRVETFGYPDVHWVRITVDPARPDLFTVQPEIVTLPPKTGS
jgi:hypothetical protein